MAKSMIARGLRRLGVLGGADTLIARWEMLRGLSARRRFRQANPSFDLPPTMLAYDAFGPWDPERYRRQGRAHAAYIAGLLRDHGPTPRMLCEWGCGPMRVLRHMPAEFPDSALMGLDYNPHTIAWCRARFPAMRFEVNGLRPPLPLADGAVDAMYAISVFTHLSERLHRDYAAELMRCLAPGGLLAVTMHGDGYVERLTARERQAYDRGELVVRDGVTEGSRTFVAFQSPAYVRRLFADWTILAHDPQQRVEAFWQDTWVIRK